MTLKITANFDRTMIAKKAEMYPKAGARAVNETLKQARTFASKKVREIYNIKQAIANKQFTIVPASQNYLMGRMYVKDKPIGIIKFSPVRKNAKGVDFSIRIGRNVTLVSGFVAQMESGHKGVYQRTGTFAIAKKGKHRGKMREQIKERFTVDMALMLGSAEMEIAIHKFINENLPRIFESKMKEL